MCVYIRFIYYLPNYKMSWWRFWEPNKVLVGSKIRARYQSIPKYIFLWKDILVKRIAVIILRVKWIFYIILQNKGNFAGCYSTVFTFLYEIIRDICFLTYSIISTNGKQYTVKWAALMSNGMDSNPGHTIVSSMISSKCLQLLSPNLSIIIVGMAVIVPTS